MDKLSGLMGGFERLEREAGPGDEWSRFDNVIGSSAWLGAGRD